METLTVYPDPKGQCWLIHSDNPMVKDLFGTDTLPSAFTLNMCGPDVLTRIKELNPGKVVKLQLGPLTF